MSDKKRKELTVKIVAVAIVLIFLGTALVAGISVFVK
jgi:Na+-transporting NADH:ubiquinone oxidoreductase subunit NqrC